MPSHTQLARPTEELWPTYFRNMFEKLAESINQEEFEKMKFICKNYMSKKKMSRVNSIQKLLVSLEELEHLKKCDIRFIDHLLQTCSTEKRFKMLSKILNEYVCKCQKANLVIHRKSENERDPAGKMENLYISNKVPIQHTPGFDRVPGPHEVHSQRDEDELIMIIEGN